MKICPRCKKEYSGYPALSRRDNKTDICSDCGTDEAIFDFAMAKLDKRKDVIEMLKADECRWLDRNEDKKIGGIE